ncbi:MAG: hypothetical protein O7E57_17345, partial [Gammaproteobacteria bacterium]|nr:hypothetical protein [Gammaproteobacteria bacterium]
MARASLEFHLHPETGRRRGRFVAGTGVKGVTGVKVKKIWLGSRGSLLAALPAGNAWADSLNMTDGVTRISNTIY